MNYNDDLKKLIIARRQSIFRENVGKTIEYKALFSRQNDLYERICSKLGDSNKELFNQYIDTCARIQHMTECNCYIEGFRDGIKIVYNNFDFSEEGDVVDTNI